MLLVAAAESGITETVISGPFVLAALLSLAAGLVSFASPCVVPLVPGYLSYLAGLVGAETAAPEPSDAAARTTIARQVRWRAVSATALFVAGFSIVFIAQSALVFGVYSTLLTNQELLIRISGGVAIVMGLILAGAVPLLQREWRPGMGKARAGGMWGAPILGAAFGTGWLACTSPTLVGLISLAATEWNGNAARHLVLVTLYCAGLGIPFLILAVGFGWATSALKFLRKHARSIQLTGAILLIMMGIVMLAGWWNDVLRPLRGSVLLL